METIGFVQYQFYERRKEFEATAREIDRRVLFENETSKTLTKRLDWMLERLKYLIENGCKLDASDPNERHAAAAALVTFGGERNPEQLRKAEIRVFDAVVATTANDSFRSNMNWNFCFPKHASSPNIDPPISEM